MKELVDAAGLPKAAEWIREKLVNFDTKKLKLHLKRHRRKDQWFSGYCRYADFLVVAAIHEKMPLPFCLCKPIGSRQNLRCKRGYEYIWHELVIETQEQAMVWVAGHECWHYLCKTRQMKGNWETKANHFGFDWAEEFAKQNRPVELPLWKAVFSRTDKEKKLKVVYG